MTTNTITAPNDPERTQDAVDFRRLTWPEIMALIIAAWGVGFALGLVV